MIKTAFNRLLRAGHPTAIALSYDEAKQLARSGDVDARRSVALDPEAKPELLYFLSRDVSPAVRAAVAAHPATPRQADLVLATDDVPEVRTLVAEKVTSQIHSLPHDDAAQIWQLTVSILEALAQDNLDKVRQLVAETARGLDRFPRTVAVTLARDPVADVAVPALGYPGRFADEELVEIVRGAHDPRIVSAVARRPSIGAAVADAVIDRGEEAPIAALLANQSAQIAPQSLDRVINRADSMPSWREPLNRRHEARDRAAETLSGTLGSSLRDRPAPVPKPIGVRLHERLVQNADDPGEIITSELIEPGVARGNAPGVAIESRVRHLDAQKNLTEDFLVEQLGANNPVAIAALAHRARLSTAVVEKIFNARSGKGLVSLAWKSGYSMRLGLQLQTRVGRLAPKMRLTAAPDTWPLSTEEMAWQIEFFRTLVAEA